MSLYKGSRAEDLARARHRLEWLSPIAPLAGVLGYLALAVDLGVSSWGLLTGIFALYAIASGYVGGHARRGATSAIIERLSAAERRASIDPQDDSDSTSVSAREILALPVAMLRVRLATMSGLLLATPCVMSLAGFTGWLGAPIGSSFVLSMTVATFLAGGIQFYGSRTVLRPICVGLEDGFAESDGFDGRGSGRVSFSAALQISLLVSAASVFALVMDLSTTQAQRATEAEALAWTNTSLDALERSDPKLGLEERVAQQNRIQAEWPLPVVLSRLALDSVEVKSERPLSEGLRAAIEDALTNDHRTGTFDAAEAPEIASFRRVGDAHVWIASVDRDRLGASSAVQWPRTLLLFAGLSIAIGALAHFVRRDVNGSIDRLRVATERLVRERGHPTSGFETGDELTGVGRVVASVGIELARTTEKFDLALEQIEATVEASSQLAAELVSANAEQSERLQRAMDLVVSIDARGCEVAQSAEALNASVDDSSSSIAELGAAGAELNETASVLSSKVDEVSNSMEQMVRSVKQVSATTEKLSSASDETSSSMEEMASAMRVVDTSAESMASLSLDVVEKAELGQAKVCQTIEGMEAIREATDAAEHVIRGLGSRTLEIGGILDVIDDVADETNLLALNAAIIAAQAGEQGKAFSVVADEIKELADRVLASTKEIGGLIRSVQEESENAIGAIEAGSQSVMSGVDLSAEAGRTLEEITEASRDNGTRIGEIVASVREQTKAAGHVVELMEKVRDSADEISTASTEQNLGNEVIYRSALTMREVAQQVRSTTEEQSHGFGRIRDSVEGVRTTVEHITTSLQEQTGACGEVSTFLQQICEGTRSNEEAFEKWGGAMKELLSHAASLREDVERTENS